mmetsp:Transcript_24947/g.67789  ORF Transcript_24947/g.67789 Transcript_24947/m.67789 type:complete len:81 (+) Transcript_24947:144-386(+)
MPCHEHSDIVPATTGKVRMHVLLLKDIPDVHQLRGFFTSEIKEYLPSNAFITDNRKKSARNRPTQASRALEMRACVHGTE